MKKIRHNVFETNSSSSHSISISSECNGILETLPVENGVVTISGGSFHREWARYNDSATKATYAYEFAKEASEDLLAMFVDVIKEHTGAKEVKFNEEVYGGIDHQSGPGEGGDAFNAFADKETLKNWIFNPFSWLFLGSDEGGKPPMFYDVDPNIVYKYQLFIDGIDTVMKFVEKPDQKDHEFTDMIRTVMEKHPDTISTYIKKYDDGEEYYEFKEDNEYFKLFSYDRDIDGEKYNSFDKFKDGIITLFKIDNFCKHKNGNVGPQRNFENDPLGYNYKDIIKFFQKVIETKEIRFELKEI